MKNFIQSGDSIDIVAPVGGTTSGKVTIIGSLIGVASLTALVGAPSVLQPRGVFGLDKVSAQAWTVGAKIYWDSAAGLATTVSAGNTLIGIAVAVADNPSATGQVRLGPTTV